MTKNTKRKAKVVHKSTSPHWFEVTACCLIIPYAFRRRTWRGVTCKNCLRTRGKT